MSPFGPWWPPIHPSQGAPEPRRVPLFRKRDDWALWAAEFSVRARRRWERRARRLR